MARKYDLISELYNRTCKTVVSNPQNWQAFLASACRNYKLRYDEQLLVRYHLRCVGDMLVKLQFPAVFQRF